MVLIKLQSTLVDDNGDCAVEGLGGGEWTGADFPEDRFRAFAGMLQQTPLIGTGSLATRLFARPSVTVLGVDAPDVATGPNAIIPFARAKVSARIPAGVSGRDAEEALVDHLRRHAPWGIAVEWEHLMAESGTRLPTEGPGYAAFARAMAEAYGCEPVEMGVGGSVPFVANLNAAFPDLEVLGVGAQDPAARIHAPNESVDLAELRRFITSQLLFLQRFGG
jgi:acetylornithine deacetylase/succinyl-diaminopimelate desuccinylase-like protein